MMSKIRLVVYFLTIIECFVVATSPTADNSNIFGISIIGVILFIVSSTLNNALRTENYTLIGGYNANRKYKSSTLKRILNSIVDISGYLGLVYLIVIGMIIFIQVYVYIKYLVLMFILSFILSIIVINVKNKNDLYIE